MFDHMLFYPAAAPYYAACLGWMVLMGVAAVLLRRGRFGRAAVVVMFSVTWCGGWIWEDHVEGQPNRQMVAEFEHVRQGMSPRQVQQLLGLPTAVKQGGDVPMMHGLPHGQSWFRDHDQLIYHARTQRSWSHPLPHWPFWRVEPFYDCDWLSQWFADRFTLAYMRHVHSRPPRTEPLYLVSVDARGQVVDKHVWPP